VQLFDGNPSVARCTKVILSDVESSPELLAEINAMNVNRTCNRLWYDNGMVVIGSDLMVYGDLNSVQHMIEKLKCDSEGLEATFAQVGTVKSEANTQPRKETE